MKTKRARRWLSIVGAASLLAVLGAVPQASAGGQTVPRDAGSGSEAPTYVADFVSTAATGTAMNAAGDVTGTSYTDPGCGPFCLPPLETVVWRGGQRTVLPAVPGFSGITVRSINAQGWVAGFAGLTGTQTHAVVWKPNGATYQAVDLGTLPGTTISDAVGIDDQGRVVGWSTTSSFPPNGSPFMWTESGGMIDLSAQGFPDDRPLAISPGGAVATQFTWYRLGDPASVVSMPPAPQGFTVGVEPTAINDNGDQARFLISTSTEHLRYLFRFHHEGTWQQVSFTGIKNTIYGVGSITAAGDITATVVGAGQIAYGPDGLTQPLVDLLSPAYKDRVITVGGPINSAGQILAEVMVGRAVRLMRLTPGTSCGTLCIRISALQMKGKFVQDPNDPGHCTQGGSAYNLARVKVTVTSEAGAKLGGVRITGRFLDDYWTNTPVSGTTNSQGIVSFDNRGPCGIGAVAFLVEGAQKGARAFDRTIGVLTAWVIPQA
jgi:probable HAF family extracellular repeat protein